MNAVIAELEQVAGRQLVQREPYPVVAPAHADLLPELLRTARRLNQKVLVLGLGSSFDEHFSLLRDNVIAITTSALTQVERGDEFTYEVGAGAAIRSVIKGAEPYTGRTIGGWLARQSDGPERGMRRQLARFVRSFDCVDGEGRQLTLPGPACTTARRSAAFEQFCGSCGRLAILTKIVLTVSPPIPVEVCADSSTLMSLASAGRTPFSRDAAASFLDVHETFRW